MCRIAGFASLSVLPNREERLKSMLDAVAHGGPDDSGQYMDDVVALGHRRLSIIDLSSAGHQPMVLGDELIISFNGEIYNYQSLKKELQGLGVIFKTQTDTEVILHAYRQWGTSVFDRFEGIFAFALYDKERHKLLLVRDHIGVKPLYYHFANKLLVFGSEVRVFAEFQKTWKENENWRILFLAFGSIPHPYTTIQDVYQLNPGSFIEINMVDFSYAVHQYKQLKNTVTLTNSHEELEAIKNAVRAAVKKNLISDAPLGVFLSGGIDSSLLTLLADQFHENIKTLSVNFDEASFDEYPYQKLVLEKTNSVEHISYRVSEHMFWESLPDIWKAMDQPTIDGVNSYFVSKCANKDGLKVVLSGLGADEIFGGYASFKRIKWIKRLRSFLPFKQSLSRIIGYRNRAYQRLMYLDIEGPVGDYLFLRGIHTPYVISGLLDIQEDKVWKAIREVEVEVPFNSDDREYVSILETRIYMTNQLLRDTDCMGMWHGLEVRVPYLDVDLLRQVHAIKPSDRYKDLSHKYLLTKSFLDLIPVEIAKREKKGFTFPIMVWIKDNPERFKQLIDKNVTAERIIKGFEGGLDHWSKYWSLAVLKQFASKWQ